MTDTRINTPVWAGILATVTLVGGWGLACIFPFAALATIAALTLGRRDGALLVGAIWLGNQAVGYGLLGYPWDAYSLSRGVALGVATLAAFFVARAVARGAQVASVRSIGAFAAAFVTYEGLLFVDALASGSEANFVPTIVAQIAINDTLWFAGLSVAWLGLQRLSASRPALRFG